MTAPDDRKMFSPLRGRSAVSPEGALATVLGSYAAGATATTLAHDLVMRGFATGARAPVAKRVAYLLDDMEAAGTVERIRDGRYRVVRTAGRGAPR